MKNNLLAACLVLCWMLSSEALVIVGKLVSNGWLVYFLAILLAAIIILGLLWFRSSSEAAELRVSKSSFVILSEKFGPFVASSLCLAAHLSIVIILPTAMLVTAGFTFNETFVYWFPNFGFSYLLLVGILALNLFGKSHAKTLLFLSTSIVVCCFIFLIIAGLLTPQEFQIPGPPTTSIFTFVTVCCFAFLLFLGFDQTNTNRASQSALLWTLLFSLGILLLWGLVTFKFVDSTKLSQTTIPYVIAAREILGQTGRIIIGLAIISGTISVVNGLLLMAVSSTEDLVYNLYSATTKAETVHRLTTTVITFIIGVCMGVGLAGSEHLEMYIFGVLLLWLLHYTITSFAAAMLRQRLRDAQNELISYVFPLFPLAAFCWLLGMYNQTQQVTIFLIIVLFSSAILSAVLVQLSRNQTKHNRKENQL